MSVRVVARIRPLLKNELDKDVIVTAAKTTTTTSDSAVPSIVRIPNPKNDAESFSFQFSSVYEQESTQQDLFDKEVAPTVKHLFNGFDTTIFAYGVTGTGKTHTMRGGKSLADRGVVPRLLSSIYRRAKKVEKDTAGSTKVEVSMSYYEIYTDRVFDLFEGPEKRTAAGLPVRDNGGKTVVVGLTERPCGSLREFEALYDQANVNRSTSATKLNAHSSRSHAILCVKLTQTTGDQVLISNASAIDLAGSEDNRRTDNDKHRLVESSAINKSLFVLAQCVEAISKKHSRIPYRESKMTRILSLGQNNGFTLMILNLAPVRSYHLDTLSSLNFANRTKKIEVNEIENEPVFVRGLSGTATKVSSSAGGGAAMLNRQPLRALTTNNIQPIDTAAKKANKATREFSVYTDKTRSSATRPPTSSTTFSQKRPLDSSYLSSSRPVKVLRQTNPSAGLTKAEIEEMIERRVDAKLAEQALTAPSKAPEALPSDLQQRLNALEQRVSQKEDSEGLQYLLMAKQHQARGEDASALKMYQLAQPFYPRNEKLERKIAHIQAKMQRRREEEGNEQSYTTAPVSERPAKQHADDDDYQDHAEQEDHHEDDSFVYRAKIRNPTTTKRKLITVFQDTQAPADPLATQHLLDIINSRDMTQIRGLKGVGAKKAELIVNSLLGMGPGEEDNLITDLGQLGALPGVGVKSVENMLMGLGTGVVV